MSQHFKPSLSRNIDVSCEAIVKWRMRVSVKFTMTNGGSRYFDSSQAIVIRRVDVEKVHDYARLNCNLRDYLLIRLPMKIGLRTSEIATLSIENINFKDRSFQVLDSKKHRFYPLPLDVLTLQLIKDLIGIEIEGYVFKHEAWQRKRKREALGRVAIWTRVHQIGLEAGVQEFNPRILRHYFAAKWHYVERKSTETLRRILRHKNLSVTHRYLAKLVFFEDIQREYEETKQPYILEDRAGPSLNSFYREHCVKCENEPLCKFAGQMPEYATGCRYEKQKKEEIRKFERNKTS